MVFHGLFMVFEIWVFENHEMTRKKANFSKTTKRLWKHHQLSENHQKTTKKPIFTRRIQTFNIPMISTLAFGSLIRCTSSTIRQSQATRFKSSIASLAVSKVVMTTSSLPHLASFRFLSFSFWFPWYLACTNLKMTSLTLTLLVSELYLCKIRRSHETCWGRGASEEQISQRLCFLTIQGIFTVISLYSDRTGRPLTLL